jgi:hypothetical protein
MSRINILSFVNFKIIVIIISSSSGGGGGSNSSSSSSSILYLSYISCYFNRMSGKESKQHLVK